jgi:hypothetical protein
MSRKKPKATFTSLALCREGRARPSPTVRWRRVHTLACILPALGVRVTSLADGRVNVSLPAEVAELFILDLEQRAAEWEAAMRSARVAEARRQAEVLAERGTARCLLESQEEDWARQYARLRARGLGHRPALHQIHEGLEDKPGITSVELGVSQGRARLYQRGEMDRPGKGTREAAAARRAEIVRLAQEEGKSRREIADTLGVSYCLVLQCLQAAGIAVPDRRKRPPGTIRGGRSRWP